jgi:hypothetical protein
MPLTSTTSATMTKHQSLVTGHRACPDPVGVTKSFPFTLLRTLLHFFAFPENSTLLFSIVSALFHKKHGLSYFQQLLFPDSDFFRIRISQISNRGSR